MLYSAYLYDYRIGWSGIHRITEAEAIQFCRDYRFDWDGRVALVPYGIDPQPYFALAFGKRPGKRFFFYRGKPHLRLVA